jgi:sortase (surface protein transpeptidase)
VCQIAVGVLIALASIVALAHPAGERSAGHAAAPGAEPAKTPTTLGAAIAVAQPREPAAVPVRLRVPALHIDAPLQHLGLEPDGTLEPPSAWNVPGWYARGPRPGDPGPAVIAGHVDSTAGPAVFFSLRDLRRGDAVLVVDRRGTVHHFVVDGVRSYPKDRFPTASVYGPQPLPVLRLITCTGAFDEAARSYVDNLVVSAHLA